MKSILIVTNDKREFATDKGNLPSLVEFAKTFNSEIYHADIKHGNKMKLEELANAICNPAYQSRLDYKIIKKLYPNPKTGRSDLLKNAFKIRQHIRQTLIKGQSISLKDLRENYKQFNLTDACLSNHLSITRKELAKEGYRIKRLKAGSYKIE